MALSKVERSNLSHKKLSNKHNDIANMNSDRTPKNFWALVKRDYHDAIVLRQSRQNTIASKDIKKKIFTRCAESLADYRIDINEVYKDNRYIPKKYR